jgi:hypothetical protein
LITADVLLLPINFDQPSIDFIRFSMPTKVPAYLKSGTPILVYGSAETAQVQYAINDGWAHTVTRRSRAELKTAMKTVVQDWGMRNRISNAARAAAANHDARVVRQKFQELLCQSAASASALS